MFSALQEKQDVFGKHHTSDMAIWGHKVKFKDKTRSKLMPSSESLCLAQGIPIQNRKAVTCIHVKLQAKLKFVDTNIVTLCLWVGHTGHGRNWSHLRAAAWPKVDAH